MRFGTVTATAPLRVRVKGDPADSTPSGVLGGATLAAGDEVLVRVVERRLLVELVRPA